MAKKKMICQSLAERIVHKFSPTTTVKVVDGSDGIYFTCINEIHIGKEWHVAGLLHEIAHAIYFLEENEVGHDGRYADILTKITGEYLKQSKEEIEFWKHNYSVIKEQHERGYEYAVKTIKQLESDLQIAKQALKKYANKGDWGDAMDENGCWINDSQFYANGYTVAETALEQITHDSKD